MMTQKTDIQQTPSYSRQYFRKKRRTLSFAQRRFFAKQASLYLPKLASRLPKHAKIGIYYDNFGELPTQPILSWCLQRQYLCYLPITGSYGRSHHGLNRRLRFTPIYHSQLKTLLTHRHTLGMKQPKSRLLLPANRLDALFLPLLAVDKQGNRMGMGGGFYDHTLAKCRHKPLKIAWCYDFQYIETLQTNPWDIAVDVIITPNGIYKTQKTPNKKSEQL